MGDLVSRTFMKSMGAKCLAYRDEKSGELIAIMDIDLLPSAQPAPCEFCKHNNIADDKSCLMCSAERRTANGSDLYRRTR